MPRRPTYLKKTSVEKLYKKCRYCKTHQSTRGFDKHQVWCKKTAIIQKELRELRTRPTAGATTINPLQPHAATGSSVPTFSPTRANFDLPDAEFIEGSSSMPLPINTQDLPPEWLQEQQLTGIASSNNGALSRISIFSSYLILRIGFCLT